MAKPLLSVVVPTKDRYKYLKHLIKLIQSFNSDEVEIVVQDNTDDNTEIVEFLNELNYSGCKYFHEKEQLPMSTNADKAILHSEGEYVCFLGDDDGVCPNALDYCRLMKEKGIHALRSKFVSYRWPDARSFYGEESGVLTVPAKMRGDGIRKTKDALDDVIRRGFVDRGDLPSVYHGIVSRVALDRVYKMVGTFFPGQSPDISNGIAMSLVLDDYWWTDIVVTISGASKYHGGTTIGMKKRYPLISDMVWFRPGAEQLWSNRLPRIAVGSIIWAESSLEALKNMGRADVIEDVDFEVIYKHFAGYYFPLRKMVYPLTNNLTSLIFHAYSCLIQRAFNAGMRILRNKLGVRGSENTLMHGLIDINACVRTFDNNTK